MKANEPDTSLSVDWNLYNVTLCLNSQHQVAPTATVDPERQVIGTGTTASMRCVVTGTPQPTVRWSRSGGDLPQNHQV